MNKWSEDSTVCKTFYAEWSTDEMHYYLIFSTADKLNVIIIVCQVHQEPIGAANGLLSMYMYIKEGGTST